MNTENTDGNKDKRHELTRTKEGGGAQSFDTKIGANFAVEFGRKNVFLAAPGFVRFGHCLDRFDEQRFLLWVCTEGSAEAPEAGGVAQRRLVEIS
jgi:hypothetical protein